jgi:hypothetical protein
MALRWRSGHAGINSVAVLAEELPDSLSYGKSRHSNVLPDKSQVLHFT